jgi:hypothetical protein
MFLYMLDSTEDDSLKFEMKIDPSLNDEIVARLGHASLNAMAEGDWPLTNEQVTMLSSITGRQLPTDLKLLIGVVA